MGLLEFFEVAFYELNKEFHWTDDYINTLTRAEINRKLMLIRRDKLDKIINEYLSYKQTQALDALPAGPLRARWEMRKKQKAKEEHETDIIGFLKTAQFLKNIKDKEA
jgi:hypothetical protein